MTQRTILVIELPAIPQPPRNRQNRHPATSRNTRLTRTPTPRNTREQRALKAWDNFVETITQSTTT